MTSTLTAAVDPFRRLVFYTLFGSTLVAAGAWWLWHPLGAVMWVVAVSHLRAPLQRGAWGWKPRFAVILGAIWGVGFTVLITFLSHHAFQTIWARSLFAGFGLVGVTYLGYREPGTLVDRMIDIAEFVGILCYVPLMVLSLWFYR